MKLNIGCGRNIKPRDEGWINIDVYEREKLLDLVIDVTKEWPFEDNSVEYIYAEQFIEHLNWLQGKEFIGNCYNALKNGGILRLVLPHYKKIFRKYLNEDRDYFRVFMDALNSSDYAYYSEVYNNPEKIKKERKDNLPPEWHFTDRERLKLRVRHFDFLIQVVHWFTHQFGEHKTIYDFDLLQGISMEVGFSGMGETGRKEIDSSASTRVTSSLYVEMIK